GDPGAPPGGGPPARPPRPRARPGPPPPLPARLVGAAGRHRAVPGRGRRWRPARPAGGAGPRRDPVGRRRRQARGGRRARRPGPRQGRAPAGHGLGQVPHRRPGHRLRGGERRTGGAGVHGRPAVRGRGRGPHRAGRPGARDLQRLEPRQADRGGRGGAPDGPTDGDQKATLSTGGNSVQSSPSSSTTLSIPQLRAALNGRVIALGDPGYDRTRALFTGGLEDLRPAVIVRVADAADVARVVALAHESGLELAVRSGGHSGAGHSSTDGGIVLGRRDMTALEIDPQTRTAWAETGLSAAAYSTAAAAHGLATGFGDTGSVGIGGITLGGGIGYLVRKHGLTVDDLLAADIVTADGRLLRTAAHHHPDLFWAIRGGGGNFGVATRFQYRLHPVPSIVGGMLLLPASAGVVAEFIALAEAAPGGVSMIANVMPAPPLPFVPAERHGQLVILAIMAYAGPTEAGEHAVAPFRALAAPIADLAGRPSGSSWPPWPTPAPPGRASMPSRRSGRWRPRSPTWSSRCPTRRSIRPRIPTTTRPRCRTRCSSTPSTVASPTRSCSTCRPRTPPCGRRSCGCLAGRWRACRRRRPRSPPAVPASWSTSPPSTTVRRTGPCARPGSATSRRRCSRATRAPTSASWSTRARSGSARPTRDRPGSGWRRSRPATTRP